MHSNAEKLRNFLKTVSDTGQIIKHEEVEAEIKKEYNTYSNSFGRGELSDKEMRGLARILLESNQDKVKKKALTLLAHLGTMKAFQAIEGYYYLPEKNLKQWTALAMHECKLNLEHALLISDVYFNSFSRGAGNNMRIYVLLLSPTDKPFTAEQLEIIETEFQNTAKELKCTIESVDAIAKYNCASLLALIPFNIATDTLMKNGIDRCNNHGDFVYPYYYVETGIPDEKEIPNIIKKIKEG